MRKICVFGANGYVGTSVFEALRQHEQAQVIGADANTEAVPGLVRLDVNDPERFSAFYKKERPDVVVWSVMAGPQEYELSDQGLLHLIAHLTPCTKLVYISSDFVFARGKGPYTEQDPLQLMPETYALSNYANAKIKAEKFIQRELTNYIILRSGPVYGENARGRLDVQTEKLERLAPLGKPAAYRDDLVRTFVHIDDLVKIVVEMSLNKRTGIYHVGRDKAQSFYEFMKEQAVERGYDPDLVVKEERKLQMNTPQNLGLITERIRTVIRQQIK